MNSEINFSFDFAGRKKALGSETKLWIKVAELNDERKLFGRWILNNLRKFFKTARGLRNHGVPYVNVFDTDDCYFVAMLRVHPIGWKIPDASETVKIRELVEVFWQVVRIVLRLISFEMIVVFIFVLLRIFSSAKFWITCVEAASFMEMYGKRILLWMIKGEYI